jgi:Xaa-Pro aminopeptidase
MRKAPQRGFDDAEFQVRCDRIQRNMSTAGIDVLWLTSEADVRYITGFLTQFWQSPTRPWHVLLPQTGKPVAVIPSIGLRCMQQTWVDDIRTWVAPNPNDDGVSLLIDTITELAGQSPRIGFPMAAETQVRCCWQDVAVLQNTLNSAQWVDATAAIRTVRQIKSSAELEKIAHICAVTSQAFSQVPLNIRIGMSEIDAFKAFKLSCLQAGADDPTYVVGKADADGYDDIISPPGQRAIRRGDVLILDTGCCFDGYYSDFDRNFAFDSVDDRTAIAHQRVWDATEFGMSLIKPGVSCEQIFYAMHNALRDGSTQNAADVGRLGHGLGMQLTETPSISAFDQTVLRAGMVITLEPGYSYAPGKVMVHEENLVITNDGARLLSERAPRDIPVI